MKKSKKILVVGGGVAGLISSCVLSELGADVKLFEPEKLGGEFLSGGLRYIRRADSIASFFMKLDLVFSNYSVKGGILYRGDIKPLPGFFYKSDKEKVRQIQIDYYKKTRFMEPIKNFRFAMNDSANSQLKGSIGLNLEDMVKTIESKILSNNGEIIKERAMKVVGHRLFTNKNMHNFDYMVLTVPLWEIKEIVDFHVPESMAMNLNLIKVNPRRDKYLNWDYVYTPYTPSNAIHRFTIDGGGYVCEINGHLESRLVDVVSDINFLFGSGWTIDSITSDLKGYLYSLKQNIEWPDNVVPLGKYAQWKPNLTIDKIFEDSIELGKKWVENEG